MNHFLRSSTTFFSAIVFFISLLTISLSASAAPAGSATETLRGAVDGLIAIVTNGELEDTEKKARMAIIIDNNVDMQAMSQRILARMWKTSPDDSKVRFVTSFKQVLVNTYYAMLKKYDGEEVEYLRETIKRNIYATVDTNIISGGRKTPVKFRLLLRNDEWRIYDYVVEGVSMVRTYNSSYKPALKRGGIDNLNTVIEEELALKNSNAETASAP